MTVAEHYVGERFRWGVLYHVPVVIRAAAGPVVGRAGVGAWVAAGDDFPFRVEVSFRVAERVDNGLFAVRYGLFYFPYFSPWEDVGVVEAEDAVQCAGFRVVRPVSYVFRRDFV